MDIKAMKVIVIIREKMEAAICHTGTSVAKILQGMVKGAENGMIEDIMATFPSGNASEKYPI